MNLRGIDLPNLDTLRLLWILARRKPEATGRVAAVEAAMPEMWYPHLLNLNPSQYFHSAHPGVDWPLPTGTPLYAMFRTQITQVGSYATLKGYAYRVTGVANDWGVANGWGFTYAHMLPGSFEVRVGQWVEAKEYLGRSDNTGWSTGPHLHAGVFNLNQGGDYGGGNIDFLRYLKRWTKDTPTPPPDGSDTPTGERRRCWRNAPIQAKQRKADRIGVYRIGTVIMVGTNHGEYTWVDGQHGQPSGFVKSAHLVKA